MYHFLAYKRQIDRQMGRQVDRQGKSENINLSQIAQPGHGFDKSWFACYSVVIGKDLCWKFSETVLLACMNRGQQ